MLGIDDLQEASESYLSSGEDTFNSEAINTKDDDDNDEEKFFASREGSVLTAIREFQVEGLFCDVTLTTSCGRVVPAHKNILAAVSCYFQGIVYSLPSWPSDISRGVIMSLRRRDMIKALKDYPGNKS